MHRKSKKRHYDVTIKQYWNYYKTATQLAINIFLLFDGNLTLRYHYVYANWPKTGNLIHKCHSSYIVPYIFHAKAILFSITLKHNTEKSMDDTPNVPSFSLEIEFMIAFTNHSPRNYKNETQTHSKAFTT